MDDKTYKDDLIESAEKLIKEFRKKYGPLKLSSPLKKISVESIEWIIEEFYELFQKVLYTTNIDNHGYTQVENFEIRIKDRKVIAHWKRHTVIDVRMIFPTPDEWIEKI